MRPCAKRYEHPVSMDSFMKEPSSPDPLSRAGARSDGGEGRYLAAADPDQVFRRHGDGVGVRAGVEVDARDLAEARVVDRAQAEETPEGRNGALAQAGRLE